MKDTLFLFRSTFDATQLTLICSCFDLPIASLCFRLFRFGHGFNFIHLVDFFLDRFDDLFLDRLDVLFLDRLDDLFFSMTLTQRIGFRARFATGDRDTFSRFQHKRAHHPFLGLMRRTQRIGHRKMLTVTLLGHLTAAVTVFRHDFLFGWTRSMAHTGGGVLDTGFPTHLSLTLPFEHEGLALWIPMGFLPQGGQLSEMVSGKEAMVDEIEKMLNARHDEREVTEEDESVRFHFFKFTVKIRNQSIGNHFDWYSNRSV